MRDEVDELLVEVERTIGHRQTSGDHPANLEVDLKAQFDEAVRAIRRSEQGALRLAADVAAVRAGVADIRGTATVRSRIPGGSVIHALVRRLVSRHTNQLADSVKEMGESTAEALDEVLQALTKPSQPVGAEHQLVEIFARALSAVANYDELKNSVTALEARLERIERGDPPQK